MHEEGLHIVLASERLWHVWGFPITSSLMTVWLTTAILLVFAVLVGGRLKMVPGKVQNLAEMVFEYVFKMVEQTLGSYKLARRYFPLIATIFLFILTANWLHFFPIFGTITVNHVDEANHVESLSLFHSANADLNTTLALAIISFFVIEISGILTLGFLKYGSKFVNVRHGAINFIVGIIELVGNLARLISFSFRLFGAIFAGEVLLLVVASFLPYLVPVPLMAFEMFIGLLQAAIFAILTLAFIKIAIAEPHGGEEHKPAHAAAH